MKKKRNCNPRRSYPCGRSCITLRYACRVEFPVGISISIGDVREAIRERGRKFDPSPKPFGIKGGIDSQWMALKERLGVTPQRADNIREAIRGWTRQSGYTEIRNLQKEGKSNKRIRNIEEFLFHPSTPVYDGEIFRGLSFSSVGDRDDFVAKLRTSKSMELEAMSSFSSSQPVAEGFASGISSVLLRVKNNQSGVAISEFSQYGEELEVLSPKGTKLKYVGESQK